jgi:predicted RNA-binding Zn ribbon-like protein
MRILHRAFSEADLVGGHWIADFINTAPGRDAEPREWLDGYGRLLEWAALTGVFSPASLAEAAALAQADPVEAEAALDRARALREALFVLFEAITRGAAPSEDALAALSAQWRWAVDLSRLRPEGGRLVRSVDDRSAGLDRITAAVALAAVDLLEHGPMERLKLCGGHDCAWLFLDTSKNGRRRWCSMATCGNSAKAKRHYRKRREEMAG